MINIVEVGANIGHDTNVYVNIENSKVWAIEPVPFLFKELKDRFSKNTNISIHHLAISDFDGVSKFGISDPSGGAMDYGCSSLLEFSDDIPTIWPRPDFHFIEYIDIFVKRMDTFIFENSIESIDFFHCDAQGSDLNVLKSFGEKIKIVKKGRCEAANKLNLYKGADNTLKSIIEFLESNEFKIDNIIQDGNGNECDVYFSNIKNN